MSLIRQADWENAYEKRFMSTVVTATPTRAPLASAAASRRAWFIGAVVSAVTLAALIWAAVIFFGNEVPRLNENAVVLTKFICSSRFDELPFEQQRQFYKVLDDRDDELDQAFADRRLDESEYRAGLEAAWLGKHINRVEKYFALPPGHGRVNYIAKLLDKKERKKAAATAREDDDIDADETAAEMRVEKWPSEIRTQWQVFHKAYREQKKARGTTASPPIGSTKPPP
jgi:hypothetical protein